MRNSLRVEVIGLVGALMMGAVYHSYYVESSQFDRREEVNG